MNDSREILVDELATAENDVVSSSTPDVTSHPVRSRDDESGATTAGVKLDVRGLGTGNSATNNVRTEVTAVDGTRADTLASSVSNPRCTFDTRVPLRKLAI